MRTAVVVGQPVVDHCFVETRVHVRIKHCVVQTNDTKKLAAKCEHMYGYYRDSVYNFSDKPIGYSGRFPRRLSDGFGVSFVVHTNHDIQE